MGIFMISGSINTYLKNIKLKQNWQFKKDNNMMNSHMTVEEWQEKQKEKIGFLPPEPQDSSMAAIENKIHSGQSLTAQEKEYLQGKNPELLKKAEENERVQKNFEQELRQCRTKEDVQRLRMKYINASITKLNAICNNPNIPESEKLEISWEENGKVMAMQNTLVKFIKKGIYQKLPTEAEKLAVEKQKADQEKAELQPEQTEVHSNNTEEVHIETTESAKPIQPQKADVELPLQDVVEVTPFDVEKVKRAKAAAAYMVHSVDSDSTFMSFPTIIPKTLVDHKA